MNGDEGGATYRGYLATNFAAADLEADPQARQTRGTDRMKANDEFKAHADGSKIRTRLGPIVGDLLVTLEQYVAVKSALGDLPTYRRWDEEHHSTLRKAAIAAGPRASRTSEIADLVGAAF